MFSAENNREVPQLQSNALRVSTAPNKLISQSKASPDLITTISLRWVNTELPLGLCVTREEVNVSESLQSRFESASALLAALFTDDSWGELSWREYDF